MSEIRFELEQTDYTGGDTVKGMMILELTEQVLARGVRIRCQGREQSRWCTGSGKNSRTHSQTRVFFDDELTVMGKPPLAMGQLMADAIKGLFSKGEYDVLQPGTYEFPFDYKLPPGIPADFESGGSSKIAYTVKGYVDIPLKIDLSCTERLTIYETYSSEDICPVSADSTKSFLMDSGNVTLKVFLDRNMFYPGQQVTGTVGVQNDSGKELTAIIGELHRVMNLKAHSSRTSRTEVTQLLSIPQSGVPRGRPKEIPFRFDLPADLYSSVTSSELVKVSYQVVFRLDIPWAVDLRTAVPITVIEEAGVPSGHTLYPR